MFLVIIDINVFFFYFFLICSRKVTPFQTASTSYALCRVGLFQLRYGRPIS